MCLRRAPEKYIAGAALDRADLHVLRFDVVQGLDSIHLLSTDWRTRQEGLHIRMTQIL
jgi:aryl carrier-like protein